ncbi:MAG TPA: SAM-dependent methyltransferase, partial [Streptosporangiaceae bacterium]|nr:SAM-dependent methyltransferase [Streptosporangiaceae bacterium]
QAAAPAARVVYVDNDPIVLAHARALLTSSREGATAYLDADIRDTDTILAGAAEVLDFSEPVAVMLVAVLHMLRDEEDPGGIVTRLMSAVPAGSFLVVSHLAGDVQDETMAEMRRRLNESMTQQFTMRTRAEVTRFFDGLRLVDPGVVLTHEWRPDGAEESAAPGVLWAGVAGKP